MGEPALFHRDSAEHVGGIVGMQRIDQCVGCFGQIDRIIALDSLVEKRNTQQQNQRQDQQQSGPAPQAVLPV